MPAYPSLSPGGNPFDLFRKRVSVARADQVAADLVALLVRRRDHGPYRVHVGDVKGGTDGVAAKAVDVGRYRIGSLGVVVVYRYLRALGSQ